MCVSVMCACLLAMTFLTPKGNESLLVELQLRCIYYLLISDLGFSKYLLLSRKYDYISGCLMVTIN